MSEKDILFISEHLPVTFEEIDATDDPQDGVIVQLTIFGSDTFVGESVVDAIQAAREAQERNLEDFIEAAYEGFCFAGFDPKASGLR